ncbi:MAG: hypothetical protein Ct9H300mP1_30900 [Planctomycetaceae bacterium]|nr:MAG: hypothetical protein Ct9H300mP1_30900 [Planctomycetaceae bacterium]
MILDLGLNPTPFANGDITVPVTQRIIMNHITAKRMLGLLSQTLQRHEQAFGWSRQSQSSVAAQG